MRDEWTASSWLASTDGVVDALAESLLRAGGQISGSTDELNFIRKIGNMHRNDASAGIAHVRDLLDQGGVLDALARAVWLGIERLMTSSAATGAELHAKFLQDGAGTLAYSGLSSFFRGLEGRIGAPHPRVLDAMCREHTAHGDAHDFFTTGNYGIESTPAIEWRFVVAPDLGAPSEGWPVEAKLCGESVEARQLAASGAKMRMPMALAVLEAKLAEKNARLAEFDEPALTLPEGIGARLYTGPLFVKYNAILRGISSDVRDVPFLVNTMVRLCCPKAIADSFIGSAAPWESANGGLSYESARKQLNTYATTLHSINSSVVKLGKLTIAQKVYRGISGRVLPEQFWKPNDFGVRGGIEGAFMSTTLNREVATGYAAGASGSAGFVFEIQMGMCNRGADIGFLSQYPHEMEILFAPLTGLEVQSTCIDGSVLLVQVALSVNLASLTIEQVIGKRKKMLQEMLHSLETELRMLLAQEGVATRAGVDFLLPKLSACRMLQKPAEWFNEDENLRLALDQLLATARGLQPGGAGRADALSAVSEAERKLYGFPPGAFTPDVARAVRELGAKAWRVREAAFRTIGRLDTALLAQHVASVLGHADDSDWRVRTAVLQTIGRLEATTLAQHADVVATKCGDVNVRVRELAVWTIGQLHADRLRAHVAMLSEAMTNDADGRVRAAAIEVLGRLDCTALAARSDIFMAKLHDTHGDARAAALRTMSKLEPATLLAPHATSIVAMLTDDDFRVSHAAVQALRQLEPPTLTQHAPAILAMLAHEHGYTRRAASQAVTALDAAGVTAHVLPRLTTLLEHPEWYVREAVVESMATLDSARLSQDSELLHTKLEQDTSWYVRRAAAKVVRKLQCAGLCLSVHSEAPSLVEFLGGAPPLTEDRRVNE